jgi:hypothetical protein
VLLVVAHVGANILARRTLPTLDDERLGRHEYGTLIKLFVFAIVIGGLGAFAMGHMAPYGLR